jgi:hypothetical protein
VTSTIGHAVALLGIALHAWICFVKADGGLSWFVVGLFVFASLPYVVGLGLLWRMARPLIPLCGMLVPLALDAWLYDAVFVHPRGSTAAVGLVIAPIWKLAVGLPAGLAIGWLIERMRRRRDPG